MPGWSGYVTSKSHLLAHSKVSKKLRHLRLVLHSSCLQTNYYTTTYTGKKPLRKIYANYHSTRSSTLYLPWSCFFKSVSHNGRFDLMPWRRCWWLSRHFRGVSGGIWEVCEVLCIEQQNLHKAVACHTLSLPLLFTEVLVLQVLRTNPSEVY